eukprot:gene34489-41756_t
MNKQVVLTYLLAMFALRCALRIRSGPPSSWSSHSRRLLSSSPSDESSSVTTYSEEQVQEFFRKITEHQRACPKPSQAQEVKSLLLKSNGYGVLSTNSVAQPGFPIGSIVGFWLDEEGKPFSILSSLSGHTADLRKDGRCSLLVSERDFKGADNGRVTLAGVINRVSDEAKRAYLRELYLKKHPDAYWIDFGDFDFFAMEAIESIRYVGGFARAASVSPTEYLQASPDPLLAFAEPVMKHMNEDHRDTLVAMVAHYVGVPCTEASMCGLDQFGMMVSATLPFYDKPYKLRLPFPKSVTERKAVKEAIVSIACYFSVVSITRFVHVISCVGGNDEGFDVQLIQVLCVISAKLCDKVGEICEFLSELVLRNIPMGNRAVSFDSGAYRYSTSGNSTGKRLSSPAMQRKRLLSSDSIERDDYGWYDDFEPSPGVEKVLSA